MWRDGGNRKLMPATRQEGNSNENGHAEVVYITVQKGEV